MKRVIGIAIIIVGVLLGLYVGLWLMFIKPILSCCGALDEGTLTALKVGVTIFKCIFAAPVGGVIAYLGMLIGAAFVSSEAV